MTGQYITDAVLAPSRARSPPDDGAGGDRKRRRKVLSCYDCRRRKLQCDRVMPACGRCVKAGQESSCVYSEDATDSQFRPSKPPGTEQIGPPTADPATTSSHTDAPPSNFSAKMTYQERRIQQLEAARTNNIQSPRGRCCTSIRSIEASTHTRVHTRFRAWLKH